MCGLVGYFGNKKSSRTNFQDKKGFVHDGLFMSALRGMDATGVAFIRDNAGVPLVYKRALIASDFLQTRMAEKMINDLDSAAGLLGHTRSATRGWVNNENAHPFQYGHITLTHNGHITNYRTLKGGNCDSDVDSAHVAAALAAGEEDEVIGSLYGDFALVWHNTKDGSVNFARNTGRPLHFATVAGWEAVAYASELEMLGAIMSRNNMKYLGDMFYASPGKIYKFFPETFESGKEATFEVIPFEQRQHGPQTRAGKNATEPQPTTESMPTHTENTGGTKIRISPETVQTLTGIYGKMKTAHYKNSGRPTGKKAVAKAIQKLKARGLQYEKIWGSCVIKFVPYANQTDLGCAIIEYYGNNLPATVGEIHNITTKIYEAIKAKKIVYVLPVNVRNHPNGVKTISSEIAPDFLEKALHEYDKSERSGRVYRGPSNSMVSRARFEELAKDGCCICSGYVNPDFDTGVLWSHGNPSSPCCHVCTANPATREEFSGFLENAN